VTEDVECVNDAIGGDQKERDGKGKAVNESIEVEISRCVELSLSEWEDCL
jgi:hypothetical protein